MPSIKVLAISPYPGMVPLLTEVHERIRRPELTISVGDLAKGAGARAGKASTQILM